MNISQEKAIELINRIVKEKKTQVEAARYLDISPAYLGEILRGTRPISGRVAGRLGYKRVISYAPLAEK